MKRESYSFPSVKVVKTAFRSDVCIPASLYGIIGQPGVYDEDNDIIYDPDEVLF